MTIELLHCYPHMKQLTRQQNYYTGIEKKGKKFMLLVLQLLIYTCNKFMAGVDLLDSRLSLYRIQSRSKKWYLKLLYHFFDMIVVQLWLYTDVIVLLEMKKNVVFY